MENIFNIIKEKDTDLFCKFLDRYPQGLERKNEEEIWALHKVMEQGTLEMVQYVVEYTNANLNFKDKVGNTVLHYAVQGGNLEVVRYLVERGGCRIDCANRKGQTPYDLSIEKKQTVIRGYFEEKLGTSEDELYHNPICRGMHPDPSIIRRGRDYYMVNSTFHFFPCIPISHSRDLIHWETIGYAITNPKWARLEELDGGRGYWAPDISYYEGKYYITATYRLRDEERPMRLQMVTSAEHPEGPYCEPVFLEEDGIDPSIFTDLDGKRYMLLNRGARIFEISPDGKKILSKPRLLWYGQNKRNPEGPHLLYKDGYYYLFMAEGGTGIGHRITVARSKSLMGTYESCPYNPIMRQWDETGQLQCCGHGMPVDTPEGDWYMVYLCLRPGESGYSMQGRETALDPITWTADGWPLVNRLMGPSDLQKKPEISITDEKCGNSFNMGIFANDWMTVRGYEEGTFRRTENGIVLQGNGKDMNRLGYLPVYLQRQRESCFEAACKMKILAENQNTGVMTDWDAGMTCYYDENSFLKLGIGRKSSQMGILVAEYVDDTYVTYRFEKTEEKEIDVLKQVELKIVTENLIRKLYYKISGDDWTLAATLENVTYLCSEGLSKGKRFTGAMWGVYVNGNAKAEFVL